MSTDENNKSASDWAYIAPTFPDEIFKCIFLNEWKISI